MARVRAHMHAHARTHARSRWAQVNVVRSAAAEAALVALGAEHVVNTSKPACVPTLLSYQSSAALPAIIARAVRSYVRNGQAA